MRRTRIQKGFTIIEVLLYLALFSIIIGGVMVATYQIIETSGKTQARVVIQEEGNFLHRKIDWALTGATDISVDSPTKVSITKPSLPPGENPLIFELLSGNLELARGSSPAQILNSQNVVVNDVAGTAFTLISAEGSKPPAIKATFTVNGLPFETVKYLRK
ncbi:MAG: prepilin-type N-terminal cleavage/methylation domain-containing protein [Candidatus Doudnabacteria bacterium]|nr:prepilin-type N-terminal cleavage/methylation domain-containing protein [Candidatus Doudnabacteria bacterium]